MDLRGLLFAPGAGAPSSSSWMKRYAAALATLGQVEAFDYDYMQAGRRRPDPMPQLITAHGRALANLRAQSTGPLWLVGKSMGSRVGCHLSLELAANVELRPAGLVCFGYPLRGQNGKLRDEVLLALERPILFVQGTRDAMCALDELESVRSRMRAPSDLYVVDGGDHSLEVTKTLLKSRGLTQAEVELGVLAAVGRFIEGAARSPS